MPAIFPAGTTYLAQLRSLAARGDLFSNAILALMNNTYFLSMTAAAEAGNVIKVTGQVKDQDGNNVTGIRDVFFTSKPVAGTGNLSDGGNGTVVAGAASTSLWARTDANGSIQVDVANANAELNLLIAHLDSGTTEMLALTFA